jgi:hypothetical protein
MSESQIAEALRLALDQATAGVTARPDAARLAHQRGRRRRVARGLLVGVPAVALVAGGTAYALHSTSAGTRAGTPAGTAAPHPDMLTVAYVTRHAEAALGDVNHYIVETSEQFPGSTTDTWTDPVTFNDRQVLKTSGGTAITWTHPFEVGDYMHWRVTVVNMGQRTWYSDTVRASGPMQGQPSGQAGLSPFTSPAQIKRALADGQVTIAGKGTANGQAAVELRVATKNGAWDYWVSAQSYQPVKMVIGFGKDVINISWFAKTKSLVAQVNTPQIPAGFRHVSAPKPAGS